MNVRQALYSEKRFLSPRMRSNPQPSDDQQDAVTIELPRLRWRAKVQFRHMWDLSGRHFTFITILIICILEMWELGGILNDRWTFVNSNLRKTISEPQMGIKVATFWWPVRHCNHWTTKIQKSDGCGFDPRLGLRNRFSEDKAWRTFIYHWRYLQASTFPNYISSKNIIWHQHKSVHETTWHFTTWQLIHFFVLKAQTNQECKYTFMNLSDNLPLGKGQIRIQVDVKSFSAF